jgi:polar amino acid transport system substrate-binding protein
METLNKFLLGLLILISFTGYAEEKVVRLTNGEWKPFLSETTPNFGFVSHIITEAFAAEGYRVEYSFYPWARAYDQAKKGAFDGSAAWMDGQDRRENFYLTNPISEAAYHFFYLKDDGFDWETLEDLQDISIGATLEYTYTAEFISAAKNKELDVQFVSTDEMNLKKLLKGRIKIFPGEVTVTYGQLRSLFPESTVNKFTHHPKPLTTSPLHLLLSKKADRAKELNDVFNSGLEKIKKNGTFDQVMADAFAGKYD